MISHKKRYVNRQLQKGKHSANIKENNDEIVKLRNEIFDFKELIHTLANKRNGKYVYLLSSILSRLTRNKHVGRHYEALRKWSALVRSHSILAHFLVKFVVIKLLWLSGHCLLENLLGCRGGQSGL